MICLISILLEIQAVYPQQVDNMPCFYKNGSSYLKLNNDTAEFKICRGKLSFRYLQGKGSFYIKDSVIWIKTTLSDEEKYPKYEDIGHSAFNEKLSIEVFTHNNEKISVFDVIVRGEKRITKINTAIMFAK
jgi:hypothetical protein